MRALRPFRAGTTLMLRQALGDLPRGTVVIVVGSADGSNPLAYLVQPMVSAVGNEAAGESEPLGPVVTVEASGLARSLPGFRSGITLVSP